MSDLDADLYGDLYGNDEVDPEQPQEEISALIEEVPSVVETAPITQQVPETTQKTPATAQDAIRTNGLSNGTATAPIQSYIQQQPLQPQKIPTYEQPQPNDYRESGATRQDVGFQNIPVNERSVRPSEMKDEG